MPKYLGKTNLVFQSSAILSQPLTGVAHADSVKIRFNPYYQSQEIEQETKIAFDNSNIVQDVYDYTNYKKIQQYDKNNNLRGTQAVSPIVGKSMFSYGTNQFTPPDNAVAASTDYIVSAINSQFKVHTTQGIQLYASNFSDYLNPILKTNVSQFFDPKIVYDEFEDRFIMCILNGSKAATNVVIVMFSKTNNPADGWNVYSFRGSSLVSNTWFDYPNMELNGDDLLISGNMFNDANENETNAILQIDKNDGYNSLSISYRTFTGVKNRSGSNAFTIVPVNPEGDDKIGLVLISNDYQASNLVNVFTINNSITKTGGASINSQVFTLQLASTSPIDGRMKGTTKVLDCGDTRIKQAISLDGVVHFVFSRRRASSPTASTSMIYGRIDLNNEVLYAYDLFEEGNHFAYPAISDIKPIGQSGNKLLITFQRTSATLFPDYAHIIVEGENNTFDVSSYIVPNLGLGYANVTGTNTERWGDYTSSFRVPGTNDAYTFAHYCTAGRQWSNVCERIGLDGFVTNIAPITSLTTEDVNVYPNPIVNDVNLSFKLKKKVQLTIYITDANGKVIYTFFNQMANEGVNKFSVSTAGLSSGIYFVTVMADNKTKVTKKIVK
ncbi:MAG: T9SS type A sorting domain-containing protein [Bacteroidota bacterium]|nr:T9SS type A sorting domain-containing protein [Bacteroidota bacterium]